MPTERFRHRSARPTRRLARKAGTLAGLLAALVCLVLVAGTANAAPPGFGAYVWGAHDSPYVNGIVCNNKAGQSVPLVSWDLGKGVTPAFLTTGLFSDGENDSGIVPYATVGPMTGSPVTNPKSYVDASLIRLFGNDLNPGTIGMVAQAIATDNGTPTGGDCIAAHVGGMSTLQMLGLINKATNLAGPYTVTVTQDGPLNHVGAAATLSATVTSAAGKPMPNVRVAFKNPSKDLTLASNDSITDATGKATVGISLTKPHDGPVTVTATTQIASSLLQITVPTAVPAVVLAAPTTYTGSVDVVASTRANPVLTPGADSLAVAAGTTLTPSVKVTGMNGHSGNVTLNVYGPRAVPPSGLCTQMDPNGWRNAIIKDSSQKLVQQSSNATIPGNSVVSGQPFTPTKPGCYAVTASVQTTDAEPNVTKTADFGSGAAMITILDSSVTATLDHNGVISPGDVMGLTLTVAKSHGWLTSVQAKLDGPVTAPINGCAGADWTKAKTVWSDTLNTTSDGKSNFRSAPLSGVGCYRLTGTVNMDTGTGLIAHWPLPLPKGVVGVLVLKPQILEALPDATSVVVPKVVNDNVYVAGLAGQSAKLAIEVYQAPWGGSPGCDKVDWSKATRVAGGPAIPFTGDGWHLAPSPATSAAGCISLVPVIAVDANPSVVTRGEVGARYATIIVAAPEQAPFALGHAETHNAGYFQEHAAVVGGFVLAIIAFVGLAFALISMNSSRHVEQIDDDVPYYRDDSSPFEDDEGATPFEDDPNLTGSPKG